MLTRSTTNLFVIALVGGVMGTSSCYKPGDIGERPFKCGIASPDPSGLKCTSDSDCPNDSQNIPEKCAGGKCIQPRTDCPDNYSCDVDPTHNGKNNTPNTYQWCVQPCAVDADCPNVRYVCDVPTHTFCVIPCAIDADCLPQTNEICDPTLKYCQTQSCSASNACPGGRTCDPVLKVCTQLP